MFMFGNTIPFRKRKKRKEKTKADQQYLYNGF